MNDVVTCTAMLVDVCNIFVMCGEEIKRIGDDKFVPSSMLRACCMHVMVQSE